MTAGKLFGSWLKLKNFLLSLGVIIFTILTVYDPQSTFQAAVRGLDAWWTIVFPALLPFFVLSELAVGLGLVHFLGVLLEPVMRPLFNVPGAGAFVMAVGYTSGAPVGSALTAQLRKSNLCTQAEAERLISFTNNASPLFMLVAIGVGMLGNPTLGWIIAGSHYLANIVMGLALRFYRCSEAPTTIQKRKTSLLAEAWHAMQEAQVKDKRSLGKLLGDAVKNSVQTLTLIGGFIIFFAVIIQVMTNTGTVRLLAELLHYPLQFFGFNAESLLGVSSGLFEMTLGSKLVAETNAPLNLQVSAITMILGWSGISIHAQVAAVIADTDIHMKPYILARLGQGILGGMISLGFQVFYNPLNVPVSSAPGPLISGTTVLLWSLSGLLLLIPATIISMLIHWLPRLRIVFLRRG